MSIFSNYFHVKQAPILSLLGFGGGGTGTALGGAGGGPFSATGGDTVRTYGSYTIHTFTTTGASTFVVEGGERKDIEYVVVGGGGHGVGGSYGGGGAGGYRSGTVPAVGAGTYNVQVGGGSLITPFAAGSLAVYA